ncbi:32180_t:CDS:2 [Gigaspora margarita]|uniref:32180_t:CDS:1 n=1 Tax=Gigaspora margarita TaxID=4874 RepID=A0ABN7WT96_GIGMA|nr:32180_t:CDS:2 [Gigaspora margarita]
MDDIVKADEKAEKRIKVLSIHHPEPSFPPEGAIDPVAWLNYHNCLNNYIEDLQLKPIFADLIYIKNLVAKYPFNDNKFIIKEYKASLGIIIDNNKSEKLKKQKQGNIIETHFMQKI